ncbi:MAG: hypothetical protein ACYSWU_06820 [Planctomycetota bacterium]|jgi:hypothetical protein
MFGAEHMMARERIIGLCALVVGVAVLVWLCMQDFRDFLFEHGGIEYYQSNPIMILVCLSIAVAVGLTVHFILEWRNRRR